MLYLYECSCVDCTDVGALTEMIDSSNKVSYLTMLKHCEGLLKWAAEHGYSHRSDQGVTLKKDWAVSYHKSTFRGAPCYYLCWSCIEFIWTLRPA